jgi:hypothetical protein
VEAVSLKDFFGEAFVDGYRGLHLALEMKSFHSGLSLRQIPVHDPAIRSLGLPLVVTIGIIGRERERVRERINCKQVNNKAKPERLRSARLT